MHCVCWLGTLSLSSVCTTFSYFPREFRAKFTSSLCVEHLLSVFPSPQKQWKKHSTTLKTYPLGACFFTQELRLTPLSLNSPTFVVTLFRNSGKTISSSRAQTVCLRVYHRSSSYKTLLPGVTFQADNRVPSSGRHGECWYGWTTLWMVEFWRTKRIIYIFYNLTKVQVWNVVWPAQPPFSKFMKNYSLMYFEQHNSIFFWYSIWITALECWFWLNL